MPPSTRCGSCLAHMQQPFLQHLLAGALASGASAPWHLRTKRPEGSRRRIALHDLPTCATPDAWCMSQRRREQRAMPQQGPPSALTLGQRQGATACSMRRMRRTRHAPGYLASAEPWPWGRSGLRNHRTACATRPRRPRRPARSPLYPDRVRQPLAAGRHSRGQLAPGSVESPCRSGPRPSSHAPLAPEWRCCPRHRVRYSPSARRCLGCASARRFLPAPRRRRRIGLCLRLNHHHGLQRRPLPAGTVGPLHPRRGGTRSRIRRQHDASARMSACGGCMHCVRATCSARVRTRGAHGTARLPRRDPAS